MTNTFITANTINVRVGFTFAAAGDALVVQPNVTLGSTTSVVINFAGLTDLEVTILGTLVGPGMLVLQADSGFNIGRGGTMVSQQSNSGNAGVFLQTGTSQVTIDRTLLATETIGIMTGGGGNTITVTGTVTGGSDGIWMGFAGNVRDVLVNSGTIRCGIYADFANSTFYNNGVFAQGPTADYQSGGRDHRGHLVPRGGGAAGGRFERVGYTECRNDIGVGLVRRRLHFDGRDRDRRFAQQRGYPGTCRCVQRQ